MGTEIPKQYLVISGMRVIEHVLARLCGYPRIEEVLVAVRDDDPWWNDIKVVSEVPPRRVAGGAERMHSVFNALNALAAGQAEEHDWVLVHDAARPCVRREDIEMLIDELSDHPVGGLLGLPVRDTMKRTSPSGDIRETVSREGLWHAMTPQMFRLGELREALRAVIDSGGAVTDESQAMELAGFAPRVIEGRPDNIKVTRPQDMVLAEIYLRQQALAPSLDAAVRQRRSRDT
jgi:2-C-methyl-D-erythritol 4-phosphate cytidylyltransferase